jgi:WD40 repeat protein
VLSVQFASDGRLVSVGRDNTIRVWGMDGKQKAAGPALPDLTTRIAVSADGKFTIAGDYAGNLTLWDGKQVQTLKPHALSAMR